tara:strand:- start:801 stop:1145 length:345 start_codon:yes stop_codon:yes gene_type:complete
MYDYLKKNSIFLISIGAIPAAIFRWQIDEIFIVNITGCFLLGFINTLLISKKYKLIFGFGFCGSLTSFSGWSLQLFGLISQGLYKLFFLNLISIMLMGYFAVFLGHFLAKKINP